MYDDSFVRTKLCTLTCQVVKALLTSHYLFQELLLAGILVNEARLGRNGYFQTSPKELRFNFVFKRTTLFLTSNLINHMSCFDRQLSVDLQHPLTDCITCYMLLITKWNSKEKFSPSWLVFHCLPSKF